MTWNDWLAEQAAAREAAGLTRRLKPRAYDDGVIDLAGNDYLGLAKHPAVTAAAAAAAVRWGGGAAASRLVTGSLGIHAELETELAAYLGQPAALVFSTGYHANLSIVSALADKDTLIVSDAHVHASLIDATRLARAAVTVTPHNDVAAVDAALAGSTRALVLVESIYSVLGDAAPLADLAAVCERHGALLIVDEAHGLGVHGAGLVAQADLAGQDHVIVTATLSKALGSQGGAVLGSSALIEHLVNRARPFIFDTGLAPASAAAALGALRLLEADADATDRIRRRVEGFASRAGVEAPAGAVTSIPMPTPQAALAAAEACAAEGVRVGCFRPPSVPDGISRLRVTANAGLSDEDWQRATDIVIKVAEAHR
ncbi:8-amino-7-oxononanoate synthase (BioF) [Nocardioides baekrokdamisoli]|uniref:8-amino-7-oxononanoate synthase n=1 Tax=Nocardioides baekrokdamisoli TaxID=1804624 RepID=A0A3G9J0K5_9ACTN|nr:aminotransferase class I/II-fold pyridoxal phosphate-dependent enzyme [Nocardioides baekrokdamisoli]BBH18153.1 8-amino-7-oxononanoate synthase (BioF) [Nocardioides baekrokdamisoli]